MNALEITGMCKTYATGVKALDGLSLVAEEGSIMGLLGLNGAGKTTTIRILAGLLRADKGSIRLFERPFESEPESRKLTMGFVLDEPLYFDWMSSSNYLRFTGIMYGLPKPEVQRRSDELLEFLDLTASCSESIATLSTGMKKKVSLAAAIIHRPRMLILDEPLDGIDPVAASAIKETLLLMASAGTTVIVTSHVLDTIEKLCSDIAIVHGGRCILQCPTSAIRTKLRRDVAETTTVALEELFLDLVSGKIRKHHPSWLIPER